LTSFAISFDFRELFTMVVILYRKGRMRTRAKNALDLEGEEQKDRFL